MPPRSFEQKYVSQKQVQTNILKLFPFKTKLFSLLLHGILLSEKNLKREAETCLLTVMVHEPRWVEGK